MLTATRTTSAPSVFRALSDHTRLRILSLLTGRDEICVCDLMAVLDLPQAKVSRHLAYLRKAGLVAGRKQDQWIHYRLVPPTGKIHTAVLACVQTCAAELPELKQDRSRLKTCCRPANLCC